MPPGQEPPPEPARSCDLRKTLQAQRRASKSRTTTVSARARHGCSESWGPRSPSRIHSSPAVSLRCRSSQRAGGEGRSSSDQNSWSSWSPAAPSTPPAGARKRTCQPRPVPTPPRAAQRPCRLRRREASPDAQKPVVGRPCSRRGRAGRGGKCGSRLHRAIQPAALHGAIFYRRLMTSKPFNPEDAERLVIMILG